MASSIDSAQLPKAWEPLTKRLAGIAERQCGNRGFAIITVEVLVSPKGEPAFWVEPRVRPIEPRLNGFEFMTRILQMCGDDPMARE